MRNRVTAVALAAALLVGLAPLSAPGAAASGKVGLLAARLDGAKEVPGPGDPGGRGLALVRAGRERVCFALAWTRIAPSIFAHTLEFVPGAIRGQLHRLA